MEMDHMVGKGMSMTVQWHEICVFLFKTFKTEQIFTFIIGCIFSFLVAALTVAMPALKQKLMPNLGDHYSPLKESGTPNQHNAITKIKLFAYYLIYSLAHMVNMINVMTMNCWVILCILAGVGLSFYFFCSQKKCCH